MIGWLVLAVAAAALIGASAVGLVSRPGPLLRAALSRPAVRLLLVLGWMWLGWHLFAR